MAMEYDVTVCIYNKESKFAAIFYYLLNNIEIKIFN